MKLGILAYGSLRFDPGPELQAPDVVTSIKTRTPFGIEFGRYSTKRGGAPTLVPHPRGIPGEAEIMVFRKGVTLEDGQNRLWRREVRAKDKAKSYPARKEPGFVQVEIQTDLAGVETVLYTDFLSLDKIEHPNAAALAEAAIVSVTKAEPGLDGITYLARAVTAGIETPLTGPYRDAILSILNAATLDEALLKARDFRGLSK